ncbi:MAG: tyrosine-protein phosphatase [Anaerolineae bacterium]|nr:tyrosine-protein phosphatase [Anaerolineae bacterium]
MNRILSVEGIINVRDLGGFPTEDGYSTRWKVFVRAGDTCKASSEGRQTLHQYGIKTIIDLRDESEVEDFPNSWVQTSDMGYVHLPLFGDQLSKSEVWQTTSEKHQYLHEHYTYYLDHCQPQIAAIFGAVIESVPGVLFHCFMGKDRTGLIAGLLLGVVGVPAEVIADDYAQTGQHYAELIPQWRAKGVERGENMAIFDRDVASAPETMVETLAYISTRYGGVEDYLVGCGVGVDQIGTLRERFVE